MTNAAAPAHRDSDDIVAEIEALALGMQSPLLRDDQREVLKGIVNRLGDELRDAIDQEDVTAAEHAAWGRPEQYL
jgi:hypothetical protein